jgi:hypothetical protein
VTQCDLTAERHRGREAVRAWKSTNSTWRDFLRAMPNVSRVKCDSDPDLPDPGPGVQAPPACSCLGGLFLSCMCMQANVVGVDCCSVRI